MAERTVRPRVSDSKWATQPTDKAAASIARREARQQLFATLHNYIRENGGFIVSAPGSDLRVEVPQGSSLPAALAKLGYAVQHCGTGQRITSGGTVEIVTERGKQVARHHHGLVAVDVLEIALPGA